MPPRKSSASIAYVSVGVTDMDFVHDLWVNQLGLEVIRYRNGPDPDLGRLWGLPAEAFVDQMLLATPGAETGWLHFVQFRAAADAVRKGAAPTDLGAKNLDVNCHDMPARVDALRKIGFTFRSEIGEYELDGIRAREVQMPVHDDINLVLIEVLTGGFEVEFTPEGFAGLTSFVVIVPDVEREAAFYKELFGMDEILHHKLSGPAVEMAAGLPAGTVLDLHLLGDPDNVLGRMELIEYVGVQGADRFARAVPPATGILRCGFRVDSSTEIGARAIEHGGQVLRETAVDTIIGTGNVLAVTSPAGLRIELLEAWPD
jgi:catechol 2,3-dioxygenase-like lactoylglutathione lyase family enzyme